MESGVTLVKDGGWAWVICSAAFCDLFVVLGIQYTFGVIYVALLDHFKESKSDTAWVGSIGQFCLFFLAYLSSLLSARFGCRLMTMVGGVLMTLGLLLSSFSNSIKLLYFTHGVLLGIGSSLSYLPALVMVADYFEKKRSLATGIAAAGGNIGALALAPLQQVIVESWGWRNCYRFLSVFSLAIVVCGFLFKPLPTNAESAEEALREENETTTSSTCTTGVMIMGEKRQCCHLGPRFLIWAIAGTIACFGYFIPHVNLVRLAEELGSTYSQGSLLLAYMSATSAFGKVIFGKISDMKWMNTLVLYQVCMGLTSLTSIICIVANSYEMLVIYAVVLGFLDGSFIGLMSVVTFECSNHENMSKAWGGVLMCMSLSMLVGAPAGSWLGEATGRYRNVFFLAGGPMLLGTILFTFIWFFKQPERLESSRRTVCLPGSPGEIFVYEKLTVV
ncbi:monocarboxylate transporter 12-like [Actinia tenebrosa]|uniref:Monocarboxylate transporter 12-like n=1 Tax=Actinia tenebrosa TaxID=6105 RepID=A0A6P8I471_ACTTE|nr:monocarboxylate transporter 12-like [Actinia tenebrosa]